MLDALCMLRAGHMKGTEWPRRGQQGSVYVHPPQPRPQGGGSNLQCFVLYRGAGRAAGHVSPALWLRPSVFCLVWVLF